MRRCVVFCAGEAGPLPPGFSIREDDLLIPQCDKDGSDPPSIDGGF